MKHQTLQELIESKVMLGRESAQGFRGLRCQVCNDHTERAGFKFENGEVRYNCFNCGTRFMYHEGDTSLTKTARKVLECYGITREEMNSVVGGYFFLNKGQGQTEITLESLKPQVSLFTPEISLPPNSFPLGADHHDELQAPIIDYLLSRNVDPLKLKVHFSLEPKYLNRAIIPCTRDGKVIFWQARAIDSDVRPRYLSPSVAKDAVLWGYDNIFKNYDLPLFITEGIFDAEPLDGVALLGSKLNEAKLEVLNRSRRRKIVVVDRDHNGGSLAEMALENGWEITFTDMGAGDVNRSVQVRGKLLTIWDLMKNATVPSKFKHTDGISVKSKLELGMQLALAKMTGRK